MTLELNAVHQGDCYALLPRIETASVDAIFTDPPYNTTSCAWDKQPIDLQALWQEIKRILKPGGIFVTTAAQPFTTIMINSNPKWFKYELVYRKKRVTGYLHANRRPLCNHESILIFREPGSGWGLYNPQKTPGKPYATKRHGFTEIYSCNTPRIATLNTTGDRFPVSVLEFELKNSERGKHPTQKPETLFEWLVKTYTNPGDLVLDPFAGSGTTGVAAAQNGRNYILIEREPKYVKEARLRLGQPLDDLDRQLAA